MASFDHSLSGMALRDNTDHDATGCRLAVAVRQTHVRARTISHARTPGTIPSSRCQTTRPRSKARSERISVLMDEMFSAFLVKAPGWWSQTGSNRRPPACKAGALPTELWPRSIGCYRLIMVGLGRLELPTSRLSGVRSNQLSYRPSSCVVKHRANS